MTTGSSSRSEEWDVASFLRFMTVSGGNVLYSISCWRDLRFSSGVNVLFDMAPLLRLLGLATSVLRGGRD